jgi:NitT/TauT family transport system substrate-binding protein
MGANSMQTKLRAKIILFGLILLSLPAVHFVSAAEPVAKTAEAKPVKLVLNWKPEPQFGGFYTAQVSGIYHKNGLNVDIIPGGAGTPTIQVVAAGKAEFGVVSAEEIPISRAHGSDVVALFAVYQTNPAAIITHAEKGFKSLLEVFQSDSTLAVQRGLPFYQFLEKKLGKPKAKIVPALGGITNFLADPNFAQQGFATSEPLLLAKKGVKVKTFKIADEGFNPYLTVLVARKSYMDQNPEGVAKMVASVREGWKAYLADPYATNELMHQLQPAMTLDVFQASAAAQKEFIETSETKARGLGSMSQVRWQTLVDQMHSLGLIDRPLEVKDLFRN